MAPHTMAQGLEEVIVTATKRAQNLQDVPVSVNTISALTIQEAGITDITDVAALVPALTVSTNLSPFAYCAANPRLWHITK